MDFKVYSDSAKLNSLVTDVIKVGASYRAKLHAAAVCTLAHAAEFGQCKPLNRLFSHLVSNDGVALKQYVRRAHIIIGMMKDKEHPDYVNKFVKGELTLEAAVLQGYAEAGVVFRHSNKEGWGVVSVKDSAVAKDNRVLFGKLAPVLFEAGEGYQPFYAKNNFASIRELGDAEVFNTIKQLKDKIEKGSSDKLNVNVSPRARKMLFTLADQMESLVDNEELGEPTPKPAPRKAKPAAEARPN